jgi:signal transduction histidine kinase/CheY-like chemotaxis protein
VIFRIEDTARIGGEELKLIALIDVSVIERSRKQEAAANRAKSDFIASLSHEIRTPMNGILGLIASLLEEDLSEEAMLKAKTIKKSSDLLLTIINDILDLSKIEAGKVMLEEIPFRLEEEIDYIIELFRPLAEEKQLKIERSVSDSVPNKFIVDPFRLRQVISNLLSNAIKFTERGRILIVTELLENYNNRIQLLFSIEDTGIGIPKDKLQNVFASYSQSRSSESRKYGGSGLGTTISKQLVELMNGEIWVESPSRISTSTDFPGAKFSFTVEVYSNEKLKKRYNYNNIYQLNQITVLVLTKESSPEKSSFNKLMHQFGLNIVTKIYQQSTVDTVLHHLNAKKELYQMVVISDRNNLEGFAMASKLKEEGLIDLFPTILICNNDQPGNYKTSRKIGVDYYLIDPVESKELFEILQEVFPSLQDHKRVIPGLNTLPPDLSVLVVEDNPINQKVGQSIFKNIGYEIDLAINGKEALEKISVKEYDIVFMDLFMPVMDGFEAAKRIREMGLKVPIVAISADSDDERKAESVIAGMDEFITKPVKVESVKQLLIKLFSQK